MEFTVTWRETVESKPDPCKTTKQVDGLARTIKPKASLALATAKASLARAKSRTRTKEMVNDTARKGRKDLTRWRGTKTDEKHKPVKNTQNGRPREEQNSFFVASMD